MLVAEVLRPFRNQSVLFFPNSGNAGDSLINVASFHALDRAGVRWQAIGQGANVEGRTVILGGGGNFIPAYATIRNAFLGFLDKAKEIILFPHTVRGNEDVLERMGSNVTLICRDVESYRHASTVAASALVLLAHDMAFHLDAERLLDSTEAAAVHMPAFQEAIRKHNIDLAGLQRRDRVFYARHDVERSGSIGGSDADVSAIFAFGTWPGMAERAAWSLMEMVRTSPPIETDRLHVGIAAALLGKPCVLHDNSYGKNLGVWQHSLRHHFPSVTFSRKA
jgi:exopolysaccharide biosynthesis predicted pyruvyltransferase EpsI